MRLTVRRVVGRAAAVVTAIAGLAVLVYFVVSDMCGNEILSEFASPEGTKKLVVYERNCGGNLTLQYACVSFGFGGAVEERSGQCVRGIHRS